MKFLKAWADPSTGKVFCLSEGPSKEAVLRVHPTRGPSDARDLRGADRGRIALLCARSLYGRLRNGPGASHSGQPSATTALSHSWQAYATM